MTRDRAGHTCWCAGGHRCGMGEHRADPHTVTAPGAGSATITRVRAASGVEYAEIRLRINLPRDERDARARLASVLTYLRALIGPPRIGRSAAQGNGKAA